MSLRLIDPTIKWYIKPSLRQIKHLINERTEVLFVCDETICLPSKYDSSISWYNPPTRSRGHTIFNLQEAWDHTKYRYPNTNYPYNGKSIFVPGYGGYFLAVALTDGNDIIQVNIIRRYIDDTILIYNTGQYGGITRDINVTVYDPPSELGYKKTTNGTSTTGGTILMPKQYILFYKGTTAPAVDTTTGLFQTSPLGVSKSQPNELWVNQFTYYVNDTPTVTIPRMYLGVKAPRDMEVISNGAYPGVYSTSITSGQSGNYAYPLIGVCGQSVSPGGGNRSLIPAPFQPTIVLRRPDFGGQHMENGVELYNTWFGWGEDDAGNVKYIVLSQIVLPITYYFTRDHWYHTTYIYSVDRDEAYFIGIIKPRANRYSYGEAVGVINPLFAAVTDLGSEKASAFAYIDSTDTWHKTTEAATTDEFIDNAYGFCNFYADKITCAAGLGIFTNDANYTPPDPKSAFGAARKAGDYGATFIRVPSLGDRTLYDGKIYAVVTRLKTFPATATDADLQNWLKSLQPRVMTSDEFNNIMNSLPLSFWLFGENTDEVSITAPSTVQMGSQFTVNVSCPARPNTTVWTAMVDRRGNVVAKGNGTTDANGNATITMTAPNDIDRYKIVAIVKGSRVIFAM